MNDDCLKLTAYFAERERERAGARFLGDALLAVCERHGLRCGVLLRGSEGFGRHQVLQTDRLLSLSEDLPMVLVAVDSRQRIETALAALGEVAGHGLLTLERARLLSADAADAPALGPELAPARESVKLTVYCGRHERVGRRPAFVAIVELLRSRGLHAATVLLGVDGILHGARERAHFVGANARVPLMIIGVGPGAELAGLLPELSALLPRPLVTLERARVCKVAGRLLAEPHAAIPEDPAGRHTWVKLMVHADHDARYGDRPLFMEIVRRLRAAGAGGATVLHGIWGWDGERRPAGDRLLSLRRHVPTVTVVVDKPERAREWMGIIDQVTGDAAVVTSELVPALRARGEWGQTGGLRLAALARGD